MIVKNDFKFEKNSYRVIKGKELSIIELTYWDPFIDKVILRSIVIPNENLEESIQVYKNKGYEEEKWILESLMN